MMIAKTVILLFILPSLVVGQVNIVLNLTRVNISSPVLDPSIFTLFESPVSSTQNLTNTTATFQASEITSINTTDPTISQSENQSFLSGLNIFGFGLVPDVAATQINGTSFFLANKESDSVGQNAVLTGLSQSIVQGDVPGNSAVGVAFSANQDVLGSATQNLLSGENDLQIQSVNPDLTRGIRVITQSRGESAGEDSTSFINGTSSIGTTETGSVGRCSFESSSEGSKGQSRSGCVGQATLTPTTP
eukprot:TRINITY_DN685_c0_g1_i4.p2 TRINITY_DN685_c0_g1~~TRINITY_DN685_c0_g1_i4.p2  ORF type:complete len:247 (-),score=45.49 TRINITY_DN685_c0_g1_i4:1011-1751(-)